MNLRKVLVMVLCLMLVLSCVPAMNLIPEAQAAEQTVRIEAEDTTYAVWNKYTKKDESTVGYSGSAAVGGMADGTYPAYDVADSTEDLAAGFIDKSNVPYVAFYVDVPVAGTYSLTTASYFKFHSACDNAFAVFLVNPNDSRQETVTYKGYYGAVTGTHYLSTQSVDVTLQEGRNVIYVVAATKDDDQNVNWTNIDYLEISGEHKVTAVEANAQTLYAADAPFVYGYTTPDNDNVTGAIGGGGKQTITVGEMSAATAASLRGFGYTVDAPADGYYDITVSYVNSKAGSDSYPVALLVDGVAQTREFVFRNGSNTVKGHIDFSVYLTKGRHSLTFTAPAKRQSSDAAPDAWFNYHEVFLYGGLIESDVIQTGIAGDWQYAEAEFAGIEGQADYAVWHAYSGTETNTDAKRGYTSLRTTEGGTVINYGSAANNYSWEQLEKGYLDKNTTSGVTIYVQADKAGNYQFKARYRLENPGIWDSTNETWTQESFSVFMVNGVKATKAKFADGAMYNWTYDTDVVELYLEEGINEITFIPMTADNYKSSSDWVNIDCIFVDTDAYVVPVPDTAVTDVAPANGAPYLYPNKGDNSVGGSQRSAVQAAKPNSGNAAEYLHTIPHIAYTVTAPSSSYYDMVQSINMGDLTTAGTYALFVDGEQIATRLYTGNGKLDMSCYLSAGTHTVAVTMLLPETADDAASYGYVWLDFLGLQMSSELTLADKQVMGVLYGMNVLEAETEGHNNPEFGYGAIDTTDWHASGTQRGNGSNSALTTDEVIQHLESRWVTYVEYVVDAPEDGDYNVFAGVQIGGTLDDTKRHILLQVNGVTQKLDGIYHNATAIAAIPATVSLQKGRNVIRVLGLTATHSGLWMDQDYLAVDSRLTAVSYTDEVAQADHAAFIGNYVDSEQSKFWDKDGLGGSLTASVSAAKLTEENFREASWFAFTVEAPADGWYSIRNRIHYTTAAATAQAYSGMLVDGVAQPLTTWALNGKNNSLAETFVYLTEGTHDLIFATLMTDSNLGTWVDGDYVRLSGGLKLASTQRYPVEGLVDGSVYTLSGSKLSDVWHKTTVGELKSNFFGTVTVTSGGSKLADTDIVPNGAVVSYASGTSYTVSTYNRGDVDGNDKIDIRDLKNAQEFIIGNLSEENWLTDIVKNWIVNNEDVQEYMAIIFGKVDSYLFYQPHTIGADEILAQCNPVGRLYNYRSAVFMESSASSFTLTGDFMGDVTMNVRSERGKSNGATGYLYVEVDGVMQEFTFDHNTDQVLTIASDLPAGEHTIKVSKGTYNQYDVLYVYSVSFNGTLTGTASAGKTIEFLGDSITVGYGLRDDGVTTAASAYYTYANVASDLLGADYYAVANSGWRFSKSIYTLTGEADNYIGRIYEMKTMNLDQGTYTNENPDVIVINLGTNDAIQFKSCTIEDNRTNSKFNANIDTIVATTESAQAVYNTEVAELLALVRKNNPNAKILWVYGAMDGSYDMLNGDDKDELLQNAIAAYNATVEADKQVVYVDVTANTAGKYAHPNRAGHEVIGQEVAAAIAAATGWEIESN